MSRDSGPRVSRHAHLPSSSELGILPPARTLARSHAHAVQASAVLGIRLLNVDRHWGNVLVAEGEADTTRAADATAPFAPPVTQRQLGGGILRLLSLSNPVQRSCRHGATPLTLAVGDNTSLQGRGRGLCGVTFPQGDSGQFGGTI